MDKKLITALNNYHLANDTFQEMRKAFRISERNLEKQGNELLTALSGIKGTSFVYWFRGQPFMLERLQKTFQIRTVNIIDTDIESLNSVCIPEKLQMGLWTDMPELLGTLKK